MKFAVDGDDGSSDGGGGGGGSGASCDFHFSISDCDRNISTWLTGRWNMQKGQRNETSGLAKCFVSGHPNEQLSPALNPSKSQLFTNLDFFF